MKTPRLTLSTLVPALLAVGALAEASSRLMPMDWLAFRGWEPMVLHHGPTGPFTPLKSFHTDSAYGDLSNWGNVRSVRVWRDDVFSADAWGFRNPVRLAEEGRPVDAILDGDSFAAGANLSDAETLSAQLTLVSGKLVYNAAAGYPGALLGDLRVIARRLRLQRGVVIWEQLERQPAPDPSWFSGLRWAPERSTGLRRLGERVADVIGDLRISRFEFVATRARETLVGDAGGRRVALGSLSTGQEMLFHVDEISTSRERRVLPTAFFHWLADELAKDGLGLVVVLVPNKYTVYEPLLVERDPQVSTFTLDDLERRLQAEGLRVVNLAGPFRRLAAQELPKGRFVYPLDDSHWSPLGVRLAAEEIARAWR